MKIRRFVKFSLLFITLSLLYTGIACSKKGESSEKMSKSEPVKIEISDSENTGSHYELKERTEAVSEEAYFTFEASTEESHALIRRIIENHGYYGESADEKVSDLLKQLEDENKREASLWKNIVEYWDYANNEMPVNIGKLPENLPKDDTLCIMVLGFELNDDGSMQNELIGRLNVALDCAKQYPNAYVVCTGGGTAINNKAVTEADLMGDWLLEHGLSKDRLIIENKSQTTAENAIFSYGILLEKYPSVNSIAVISSSYHIAWGSVLLEAAFMKTASEGQTEEVHVVSNAAYEFINPKYAYDIPRFETGGLLQLIGEESLAMQYYMGTMKAPQ